MVSVGPAGARGRSWVEEAPEGQRTRRRRGGFASGSRRSTPGSTGSSSPSRRRSRRSGSSRRPVPGSRAPPPRSGLPAAPRSTTRRKCAARRRRVLRNAERRGPVARHQKVRPAVPVQIEHHQRLRVARHDQPALRHGGTGVKCRRGRRRAAAGSGPRRSGPPRPAAHRSSAPRRCPPCRRRQSRPATTPWNGAICARRGSGSKR